MDPRMTAIHGQWKHHCEKIAGKDHLQPSDNANTWIYLIVIGDLDYVHIHCIKLGVSFIRSCVA